MGLNRILTVRTRPAADATRKKKRAARDVRLRVCGQSARRVAAPRPRSAAVSSVDRVLSRCLSDYASSLNSVFV